MVSIDWCLKQEKGLRKITPNENMSKSYIKMAEESITALNKVGESRIWTATAAYYVFYYSLYSLMLRLGFKCEIHSCSLEFMKSCLREFYDSADVEMMGKAFLARISLQYYADRPVDEKIIEEVRKYCKDFYVKTKDILAKITENQINLIREKIK